VKSTITWRLRIQSRIILNCNVLIPICIWKGILKVLKNEFEKHFEISNTLGKCFNTNTNYFNSATSNTKRKYFLKYLNTLKYIFDLKSDLFYTIVFVIVPFQFNIAVLHVCQHTTNNWRPLRNRLAICGFFPSKIRICD